MRKTRCTSEVVGHLSQCREQAVREASPTAAIIEAQSVKKGGASIDPHGYDAGKKVKGAPSSMDLPSGVAAAKAMGVHVTIVGGRVPQSDGSLAIVDFR